MYDDIVILVHEIDDETTEEKEVFATVESVGQNEFFSAAQAGLKAEFKISLWIDDYDNEVYVKINGHNYDIYRTYMRRDGKIELYCGKKIGV